VSVNQDLTVPGHPEIQVIGDLAHFKQDGKPLPALSPVAMQQGRHAAGNILAQLAGGATSPFHYLDKGTMATIGRYAAVADIRGFRFGGLMAWLAWLFVHLIFLVSFRNKVMVFLNWAYIYFTFGRQARLITGRQWKGADSGAAAPPATPADPAPAAGPR
jgi:NADH dehydrogenase